MFFCIKIPSNTLDTKKICVVQSFREKFLILNRYVQSRSCYKDVKFLKYLIHCSYTWRNFKMSCTNKVTFTYFVYCVPFYFKICKSEISILGILIRTKRRLNQEEIVLFSS